MSLSTFRDAYFQSQIADALTAIAALAEQESTLISIATRFITCLGGGGTIYLCGNGGSAADAQHVAAEFVGRFQQERRPLPAVALTCNTSTLTAIANDYDFSEVFARQVRACVSQRDCVVGISTSGRSQNVLKALSAARDHNASTVGFTGGDGRELRGLCDDCLCVACNDTPRIQEVHIVAWHLICGHIDRSIVLPRSSTST